MSKQDAAKRLSDSNASLAVLQKQIAELTESRSLNHFLKDRIQSGDYRKQLGFASMIRQDFQSLIEKLNNANDERD